MAKLQLIAIFAICAGAVYASQGHVDDANFVCSEQGRYRDRTDPNCRRYHLCMAGYGGKWRRSSYDCPEGTVFDASIGQCSTGTCHYHSSESSDSSDSSSDSSSEYDDGDLKCKKPGLHDDINDSYCSKYYECKKNHRGVLFAVQYPCPSPSKYNPKTKQCSRHYVCPRHFECSRMGRFEDGTDENNKRYFLCVKKKNGEYSKSVYTCPLFSRFVPEYEQCAVLDESSSDEFDIHDHDLPVETWDHLDSFVCKARGFTENKSDDSSRSFYMCDVMADGKFAKYILSCPRTYYWNSGTNLCTPGHH